MCARAVTGSILPGEMDAAIKLWRCEVWPLVRQKARGVNRGNCKCAMLYCKAIQK